MESSGALYTGRRAAARRAMTPPPEPHALIATADEESGASPTGRREHRLQRPAARAFATLHSHLVVSLARVLGYPVKPAMRCVCHEMRAIAQWRDEHVKMTTLARRFQ